MLDYFITVKQVMNEVIHVIPYLQLVIDYCRIN